MRYLKKTVYDTVVHVFECKPEEGYLVVTYEGELQPLGNICHDYWHKRHGDAKCIINLSLFNEEDGSRNGSMFVDGYSLIAPPRENDKYIEAIWNGKALRIDDISTHADAGNNVQWVCGASIAGERR